MKVLIFIIMLFTLSLSQISNKVDHYSVSVDCDHYEKGNNMSGYPTDEPCDICGKTDITNFIEPRFLYVTCVEHKDIAPIDRHKVRTINKKCTHD